MKVFKYLLFVFAISTHFQSSAFYAESSICKINEAFKFEPDIEFEQVADACDWEMIFEVGDYFSLEGIMNGLFKKLKEKASASVCKITVKDLWKNNSELIGYKWPGDVLIDVARETDEELQDALELIIMGGSESAKLSKNDLNAIKQMLEVK